VKDPAGLGELLKARCEAYEGYWQQSTYVCNRKTVCAPGTFVNSTLLQPLADRTCHPCAQGQFSEGVNSKECRPFSVCDGSQEVLEEPTGTNDRRCGHPPRVPNMNNPQWQCDTKGSVCAVNSSGAALVTVLLYYCT